MLRRAYQLQLAEQASPELEALIEKHHAQLQAKGICPKHMVENVDQTCGLCDIEDLSMRQPAWVERLSDNAKVLR